MCDFQYDVKHFVGKNIAQELPLQENNNKKYRPSVHAGSKH